MAGAFVGLTGPPQASHRHHHQTHKTKDFLILLDFVIRLDGIYIASLSTNSVLEVKIISMAAIHYMRESHSQVSTSFHLCSACLNIVLDLCS